jgi:hypothetical protein
LIEVSLSGQGKYPRDLRATYPKRNTEKGTHEEMSIKVRGWKCRNAQSFFFFAVLFRIINKRILRALHEEDNGLLQYLPAACGVFVECRN